MQSTSTARLNSACQPMEPVARQHSTIGDAEASGGTEASAVSISIEMAPRPAQAIHGDNNRLAPLRIVLPGATSYLDSKEVARLLWVCNEFSDTLVNDPPINATLKVFADAWKIRLSEELLERLEDQDGECRMMAIKGLMRLGILGLMTGAVMSGVFGYFCANPQVHRASDPDREGAMANGLHASLSCLSASTVALAGSARVVYKWGRDHHEAQAALHESIESLAQTLDQPGADRNLIDREVALRLFNPMGETGQRSDLASAIQSGDSKLVKEGLARVLASPLLTSARKVSWLAGSLGTSTVLPPVCFDEALDLHDVDENQFRPALICAGHVANSTRLSLDEKMDLFPPAQRQFGPPTARLNLLGQTVLWLAVHEYTHQDAWSWLLQSLVGPAGPGEVHRRLSDAWKEVRAASADNERAEWVSSIISRLQNIEFLRRELAPIHSRPLDQLHLP